MAAIQTSKLVKHYRKVEALKGVSLKVEKGEIYGLLGQNGAGKTTMVKILLGITKLTEGEANLLSEPAGTPRVRQRVGYLPEDHRFPDYHTGYSLLDFYGTLLSVPRERRRKRALEVLELVELTGRMNYKIRTYSKGMKQRLGIAQALLHEPEVLFLDEPTDGVDPVGRQQIRAMMQQLKKRGTTIFLNSHLLGEVELICDRVGILHRGEMVREGDVATLTRVQGSFVIGLAPGQDLPGEELKQKGYQILQRGDVWEVSMSDGQTIDPVIDMLRARGLGIRHLVEKRQTLEELFIETVLPVEPVIPGQRHRGVGM